MPTVLKIRSLRFFFYSNDHEPIHIHVESRDSTAKFNLKPIQVVKSNGFNSKELKEITKLIEINIELLIDSWHEYFGNT
ncbi:DUF4160 domain-containing protein [Belliella pelovolcani]|uniref:DUF4160 domain-containing protein n=1 Tax=Belliella pelovolcani TaxID=529505 RepID=A0A1N7KPS0_9BACT|nr:DUF4160 domain-containing protein [Belliella pelovolcani]SIS63603.1 protein of unknown function [Belliella pelovolcani]